MATRTNTCDTNPRAIMRREKMAEALRLRKHGMDYRSIGQQLAISYQTAANYIKQGMMELTEQDARACKGLLLYQLDGLIEVQYPIALSGDLAATREVRNLLREKGQLQGLYPQGGGGVHVNVGGGDTQVNHVILGIPPIYKQLEDGSTVRVSDGKVVDPPRAEGMTPLGQREHAHEARTIYPRQIEHEPAPAPPTAPPPAPAMASATPAAPEPPVPAETPRGYKARRLALEERAKAEGMSEYSDFGSPRGSAWGGYNPNRLWDSKTKSYK